MKIHMISVWDWCVFLCIFVSVTEFLLLKIKKDETCHENNIITYHSVSINKIIYHSWWWSYNLKFQKFIFKNYFRSRYQKTDFTTSVQSERRRPFSRMGRTYEKGSQRHRRARSHPHLHPRSRPRWDLPVHQSPDWAQLW